MSIDEQIKNAEIELLRLKALKEEKRKEIKPFDEINWNVLYESMIDGFVKPYLNNEASEDDPQYLYEEILQTICPYIFK